MNTNIVEPYLTFSGRCEEALEFYRQAVGAEILCIMRFNQSPEPPPPDMLAPGFENKIMHSLFKIGESTLMASDGCDDKETFGGFSLSLRAADEADAKERFNALAEGGEITMPLDKTFWSPCFGMLKDKFGLSWMIGVFPEQAPAQDPTHPSA